MDRRSSASESNREGIGEGSWKGRRVCYRRGRLVIKLSPREGSNMSAEKCLQAVIDATPGASCLRGPSRTGRAVIALPVDANVLRVAEDLDARDDVAYAEPDLIDSEGDSG